jgi:RNA polymerase sigma-70 factor (ECF subfamily)
MTSSSHRLSDPAQAENASAVLEALESLRPYLLAVAEREMGAELRQKAGPSDLVQETLIQAHRVRPDALPNSRDAARHWLKAILIRRISDFRDRYEGTQKRRISREIRLDTTSETDSEALPDPSARTPSSIAASNEHDDQLREAMDRLSRDHREVLELRVRQGRSFAEIAKTMHRSAEAVQMLYLRALRSLKRQFPGKP